MSEKVPERNLQEWRKLHQAIKALAAGGYAGMCAEITMQAFSMSTVSTLPDPGPVTMETLRKTWESIPQRPRLELQIVQSTIGLTDKELEQLAGGVRLMVQSILQFRGELESLNAKLPPLVFVKDPQR